MINVIFLSFGIIIQKVHQVTAVYPFTPFYISFAFIRFN